MKRLKKRARRKDRKKMMYVGDDFLSHMIYSGKMDVKEIAVNSIDLLAAGVDTVKMGAEKLIFDGALYYEFNHFSYKFAI